MNIYLNLFEHVLTDEGKMAVGVLYQEDMEEHHKNARDVAIYRMTDLNIKLVCLCGLHFTNISEIKKTIRMLDSWKQQKITFPLYLSISGNLNNNSLSKKDKFELKKIFEELMSYNNIDNLSIFYDHKKKSIFEHYDFILKNNNFDCGVWVSFTNYYDIWKEYRGLSFNALINLYNVTSFGEERPIYVKYQYSECMDTEVDHVIYCCKVDMLRNFLENVDNDIMGHVLCGKYFIKYLNNNDYKHLELPDNVIFGDAYENDYISNFDNSDIKFMMILYYSKRRDFNLQDYKNFWNHYIKKVPFRIVEQSIIQASQDPSFNNYRDSPVYL